MAGYVQRRVPWRRKPNRPPTIRPVFGAKPLIAFYCTEGAGASFFESANGIFYGSTGGVPDWIIGPSGKELHFIKNATHSLADRIEGLPNFGGLDKLTVFFKARIYEQPQSFGCFLCSGLSGPDASQKDWLFQQSSTDQKLRFQVINSSSSIINAVAVSDYSLSEYQTYIGEYDGQTARIYYGEILEGSASFGSPSTIQTSNQPSAIGSSDNQSTGWGDVSTSMYLSHALIFNHVFSGDEKRKIITNPYIFISPRRGFVFIPSSGATLTVSLDALIQKTGIAQTVSLDALLQDIKTATLSVDALLQAAKSGAISLDALLRATLSQSADLDALLQSAKSNTTTLDALVQSLLTTPTGLDALLLKALSAGTSLDAILSGATAISTQIDALLQSGQIQSAQLDALLQAAQTGSLSLDALLQAGKIDTTTIDALLQDGFTRTAQLDALLQAAKSGAVSLDAILIDAGATLATTQLDALVQAVQSGAVSLDAMLQKGYTETAQLDAMISAIGLTTVSMDALLRLAVLKTVTFDALLRMSRQTTANLDALLLLTGSRTAALDAILISLFSATTNLDAMLLAARSRGVSLDAIIGEIAQLVMGAGRIVNVAPNDRNIVIEPINRTITIQ